LNRLAFVDRELNAVLSFQADLNSFHIRLNDLAQDRDFGQVRIQSRALRKTLLDDVSRTEEALRDLPSGMVPGSATPSTLDVIHGSLPDYLDSLLALASAGDWLALKDRLTNQLQPLEFLSTELVSSVQREVTVERAQATLSIHEAVDRMLIIVALTGGVSLFVAGLLGAALTWSITSPLAQLMEGITSLSQANFKHKIPVTGEDELALLAGAFNMANMKLREQFALRLEERLHERTRLARELHDTLLQTIQGSMMVAETALMSPNNSEKLLITVEKLSLWMRQGMVEVRAALDSLRSSSVSNGDLISEIEFAMQDVINGSDAVVSFRSLGSAQPLPVNLQEEVYRIACEAIRNACVHSGGSLIVVEIRYGATFSLRVIDDGVGIDPTIVKNGKPGHFGLHGMKERSMRIRGTLQVCSDGGQGTVLTLLVPNMQLPILG
jgi:signal transduction histidine kinase